MACVDDYETIRAHMRGTFKHVDANVWHDTSKDIIYLHILTEPARIYFDMNFRSCYSKRFSSALFSHHNPDTLSRVLEEWTNHSNGLKFEIVKNEMDL